MPPDTNPDMLRAGGIFMLRILAIGLLGLTITGCSSSSSGGGGGTGTGVSSVCAAWQDRMCDFAADQCGVLDRAECDDDYQSIHCKSDAAAQACLDQLDGADCTSSLSACTFEAVADPAPAIAACKTFVTEICKRSVACGASTDQATCEAEAQTQIDCDRALGVSPDFDTCVEAIRSMDCNAEALPDPCVGAIKLQ
jgi:hypothetical protein